MNLDKIKFILYFNFLDFIFFSQGNECGDIAACNYNENAIETCLNNDCCYYPAEIYLDCDGQCLNDADGDDL